MRFKIILFFLLAAFFIRCDSQVSDKNLKLKKQNLELDKLISETLSQWNLYSDIEVREYSDSLRILINYLNPKDIDMSNPDEPAPYYLDVYSNDLIIKTLVQKYRRDFTKFSSIQIITDFEGHPDFAKYDIDNKKMDSINEYFKNPSFYENVVYSFENFNYDDINTFDIIIKKIIEASKLFEYSEIKYWELLRSYSKFCVNPNYDELDEAKLFIFLTSDVNSFYKKYVRKEIGEEMKNLITKCNIDSSSLEMNNLDLSKYLKSKIVDNR